MRRYWAFYWPLALTAVLLLVGMQVFNGVLARYDDGVAELAAFAYALGLFLLFDIASAFLPQLVTVYAVSAPARRRVVAFCVAVAVLMTLPVAFFAFADTGAVWLSALYHIDGAMLAKVRAYLQMLSGIILVHVGQQYCTGLLVQRRQTGRVSIVGMLTMLIQVSVAVLGLHAGWPAVKVLSWAYWSSQLFNLLALALLQHGGGAEPAADDSAPGFAELWRFFWPVAISGISFGFSRPLLFVFVSRVPDAALSIAALRVGFDFLFLFQVSVNQFRHFFTAFGTGQLAGKRRFLAMVTTVLVSLMALCVLSPLSGVYFGRLLGLRGELFEFAAQIAMVLLLVPVILAVRNYYHGILLSGKRTTAMALGSAARVMAIALTASTLLQFGLLGAVSAASAMVAGFMAEMAVATVAGRRLLRAGAY